MQVKTAWATAAEPLGNSNTSIKFTSRLLRERKIGFVFIPFWNCVADEKYIFNKKDGK